MIQRFLEPYIKEFLNEKIILITGPRQTGKTTFSKSLDKNHRYLNYDDTTHRHAILQKNWDRKSSLIVFDELHKMKNWKQYLKGIYDTEGTEPAIVVTGSAKLDTFRKTGDSLAGRFFKYRFHPFDLKELIADNPSLNKKETLNTLLQIGGFPEPFLKGTDRFYRLWKQSHNDVILKEDLVDLTGIRHLSDIETLIQLLRRRVGSPISYASLATDLQVSPKTVKTWLDVLENLYVIFKVTPFHKNVARSILKEPKYYFFDVAMVENNEGSRFENLVALSLLKELHFWEDTEGYETGLFYIRNRQGQEVDFLLTKNNEPFAMIEAKLSDSSPSPHLRYFSKFFSNSIHKIQVIKNCEAASSYPDAIHIAPAHEWLSTLTFE